MQASYLLPLVVSHVSFISSKIVRLQLGRKMTVLFALAIVKKSFAQFYGDLPWIVCFVLYTFVGFQTVRFLPLLYFIVSSSAADCIHSLHACNVLSLGFELERIKPKSHSGGCACAALHCCSRCFLRYYSV